MQLQPMASADIMCPKCDVRQGNFRRKLIQGETSKKRTHEQFQASSRKLPSPGEPPSVDAQLTMANSGMNARTPLLDLPEFNMTR